MNKSKLYPFIEKSSDMGVKMVEGVKTKKIKVTYRNIPDSGIEHEEEIEIPYCKGEKIR